MNLKLAKFLSQSGRGVFLHLPRLYFFLYSLYKRRTDAYKHELLKKYAVPGAMVLDIGAHIGYYTRILAQSVGPAGTVYAFEPSTENFRLLEKNCKKIANVKLYNVAVGEKSGKINLHVSPDLNVDHRTYESGEARAKVTIQQIALDDLLAGEARIFFIKMDIQGYEYQALSGMQEILMRDHPVIISELWPWGLKTAGYSPKELLALMENLGYKVFLLDEAGKTTSEIVPGSLETSEEDYYDVLCISKA